MLIKNLIIIWGHGRLLIYDVNNFFATINIWCVFFTQQPFIYIKPFPFPKDKQVPAVLLSTVNSEIFARILIPQLTLKEKVVTLKFATWAWFISKRQNDHEHFAKSKRKFSNSQFYRESGPQIRVHNWYFNSSTKHILWVLKSTVSMRRFFWAHKTHF